MYNLAECANTENPHNSFDNITAKTLFCVLTQCNVFMLEKKLITSVIKSILGKKKLTNLTKLTIMPCVVENNSIKDKLLYKKKHVSIKTSDIIREYLIKTNKTINNNNVGDHYIHIESSVVEVLQMISDDEINITNYEDINENNYFCISYYERMMRIIIDLLDDINELSLVSRINLCVERVINLNEFVTNSIIDIKKYSSVISIDINSNKIINVV